LLLKTGFWKVSKIFVCANVLHPPPPWKNVVIDLQEPEGEEEEWQPLCKNVVMILITK
jgi:hypothetical protein